MRCVWILGTFSVLLSLGSPHDTRKGIYISNSCRPLCKNGLSCVTFRNAEGFTEQACIQLDPYSTKLEGALIVPITQSKGAQIQYSEDNTKVLQSKTVSRRAQDLNQNIDGTHTEPNLSGRILTVSQNLKQGDTPVKTLREQDISNLEEDKIHQIKKHEKLTDMNKNKQRKRLPSLQEIFDSAKEKARGQNSDRENTRHTNRNNNSSKDFVCTACGPNNECPVGKYCYFSAECARQICQDI